MTVSIYGDYHYSVSEIKSDWEKISDQLPRNGLLTCLTSADPDKENYAYSERKVINPILEGTVFEKVIRDQMPLVRAVFVAIPPGMCLRQHNDPDNKVHLSVLENGASFYYNYDTNKGDNIPADGHLYRVNSGESHHSAVNAGVETRVHLVMSKYYSVNTPTNKYRLWFDYSNCNIKLHEKGDLRTTVDQNFMMKYIQEIVQSGKAHEIYGNDNENMREYIITSNGPLDLDDLLLFKIKHALSYFNVECGLENLS